ncbi:MAG: FMN-binding protein [Verrucomicrobia bacterium]|jgi:uncharacterized protein with FMN-binding domain|nr:FMN-binding protein [Verrucomicrobiota bacterium]
MKQGSTVFAMLENLRRPLLCLIGLLGLFVSALCCLAATEDRIELKSGIALSGKIVSISDETVTVEINAGTRKLTRKYPIGRVKAVTVDGKRRILPPKTEGASKTPEEKQSAPQAIQITTSGLIDRTQAEISSLIEQQGRSAPSWYKDTSLDFPDTLDLTWPDTKPPTWNYTRHVEHYVWDIISSNRSRYGNGIRFMHHLLQENKDSPRTLAKIMNELGRMYFEFFDDYPRAAFWWQNAQVTKNDRYRQTDSPARLAECYWRLGNRELAISTLKETPLTYGVIKLWGDLAETDHAVELAKRAIDDGLEASEVYLLAGDALRAAERYDDAVGYYQKTLALEVSGPNRDQIDRNQKRAKGTVELIQLFDKLDFKEVAEGEYEDKSYGYAGNVYLKTVVANGRLNEIEITSLSDKQYYHAVDATIKKIIKQQSVKGIDAISGATVTSEAVIRATAKAMAQGTP